MDELPCCHTPIFPIEQANPLTREMLVVFGATGAEASNNVMLAAKKKFVIRFLANIDITLKMSRLHPEKNSSALLNPDWVV